MPLPILLALLELSIFVALARWAMSLAAARTRRPPEGRALGRSERGAFLLAEAQRTARLGSYALDLSTGEVACSEELRRLLRLGPDDAVGSAEALAGHVHADDRDSLLQAWEEARGVPGSVSLEHRITQPDGSARWVDGRVRLLPDVGTGPGLLLGTMLDVTTAGPPRGRWPTRPSTTRSPGCPTGPGYSAGWPRP